MKHPRRILAALLCFSMMTTAATASAEVKKSKTFTTVPTIKITGAPTTGTASAGSNDFTINASVPGFLTCKIVDESGYPVLTIVENMEIHSKDNLIEFTAIGDNGQPIAPGDYVITAQMVNAFGLESKVAEKKTRILESADLEIQASVSALLAANTAKAIGGKPVGGASVGAASVGAASVGAASVGSTTSGASSAALSTDTMTYTAGTSTLGEEGLLIGVGVSDVAQQTNAGYWSLTADAADAEIWAALTRDLIGVDVAENESAYIYDSPKSGRKQLGTVSGISQGLNVITERSDGWSLVEAFRNEDGAFVRGYIKTDKLRTAEVNQNYGITIDKKTQTLTVYKNGTRLGSCQVATGLPTPKYPHRETPAGEFIIVTRRGSFEYYGMGYTRYTMRINGNYYLSELPTTKKNGSKFLDVMVGRKNTRGSICITNTPSTDGSITAKWLWELSDDNRKMKVLIFDDKPRTDVPVSSK